MKIYFAGSIRGAKADSESYSKIINHLKEYGQVLTEHVGSDAINESERKNLTEEEIYNRDLNWLKESDVLIADISAPSLGVGYEISKAEELGKKILCIFKKSQEGKGISAMIKGNKKLLLKEYSEINEALKYIDDFLGKR